MFYYSNRTWNETQTKQKLKKLEPVRKSGKECNWKDLMSFIFSTH
jgi:hypothetical protein